MAGNNNNISIEAKELQSFRSAFQNVMLDLAHQIVRDGEGASKFIEISIAGAESNAAAKAIGMEGAIGK